MILDLIQIMHFPQFNGSEWVMTVSPSLMGRLALFSNSLETWKQLPPVTAGQPHPMFLNAAKSCLSWFAIAIKGHRPFGLYPSLFMFMVSVELSE